MARPIPRGRDCRAIESTTSGTSGESQFSAGAAYSPRSSTRWAVSPRCPRGGPRTGPFTADAADWRLIGEDSPRRADHCVVAAGALSAITAARRATCRTDRQRPAPLISGSDQRAFSLPRCAPRVERPVRCAAAVVDRPIADRLHRSAVPESGSTVRFRGELRSRPRCCPSRRAGSNSTRSMRARVAFRAPPPLVDDGIARSRHVGHRGARAGWRRGRTGPTDTLLAHLLPSLRLPGAARRVTLYWESYGTTAADSASTSADVSRRRPRMVSCGALGIATGLATDPTRGLELRWRDQEARGGTTTLVGPVPVQMRALALDMSASSPGPYAIEIRMTLADGRSSSAHHSRSCHETPGRLDFAAVSRSCRECASA